MMPPRLQYVRKAEAWAFDIKGFKEIIMEIVSITGGTLSIKGSAVS